MINANELRIGNWVLDNSQGKNEYYQLERFRDGQEVSDFCEPIPITVEIVNKLNCIEDNYGLFYFRRDGSNKSESGMDIALTIKNCLVDSEWVWDCSVGDIPNYVHLRYIQHLHQLQNLYFALTNTELNYQP